MKLEETDKRILKKIYKPILIAIGYSFGIYLLWNWLFTSIFELPIITFWQALGLYITSKILFKSNPELWQIKK